MDPFENPYAATHVDSFNAPSKRPLKKPVSATVFGVLHLIFGILGAVGTPLNFISISMINSHDRPPNPAWDVMRDTPGYMTFYIASLAIGFVMSIVLIVAGMGLLKDKPSGRTLSIWYGFASLLIGVGSTAINFFLLYEPLSQLGGPEGTIILAIGFIGAAVGAIYPILTLIFMYRRNVVEYFQ